MEQLSFNEVISIVTQIITNEIIVTVVILLWIHHFRILNRVKKFVAYLFDKPTQAQVTIRLVSNKTPKQIGEEICAVWKANKLPRKVIMDCEHDYEITNDRYNIKIHQDEEEIVFRTSVLDTTLSQIQLKFSEILKLVDDMTVVQVYINAVLPYKFEFVELRPPSWIDIEEYKISFKKNDLESHVILELKNNKSKLRINGKSVHDMYPLIKKIFSPYS